MPDEADPDGAVADKIESELLLAVDFRCGHDGDQRGIDAGAHQRGDDSAQNVGRARDVGADGHGHAVSRHGGGGKRRVTLRRGERKSRRLGRVGQQRVGLELGREHRMRAEGELARVGGAKMDGGGHVRRLGGEPGVCRAKRFW